MASDPTTPTDDGAVEVSGKLEEFVVNDRHRLTFDVTHDPVDGATWNIFLGEAPVPDPTHNPASYFPMGGTSGGDLQEDPKQWPKLMRWLTGRSVDARLVERASDVFAHLSKLVDKPE